jgi:Bacterial Ig-like domain (group 2).
VVFDLADNSYVANPVSNFPSQMVAIINVLARIRSVKGITNKEEFNIKYGLPTVDSLAIHLPNITTNVSGLEDYDDNIYLNVVLVSDITNSIVPAVPEWIKFDVVGGNTIVVGSDTPERYKVYNIDFDSLSKLTLQEVVSGISAVGEYDPYATSLYPAFLNLQYSEYFNSKPAVAENAVETTFMNSKFTSLVNEIEITSSHSGPMTVGQTIQLNAGLTNSNANSFVSTGLLNNAIMFNTASDTSVLWFSTDTNIITVDATGNVTAISSGTATIVAKAMDINNEGEIEKPWAVYAITVSKAPVLIAPHHEVKTGVANYTLLLIISMLMGIFLISVNAKQKRIM